MQLRRVAAILFFVALGVGGFGRPALSQPTSDDRRLSEPSPVGAPAAPTSQGTHEGVAQPRLPVTVEQAFYLIRSTLLTLNDANRSGNYTVLRDLAAPRFQSTNSAADLGMVFSDLRARKVDLFAVALLAPQLSAQPQIVNNGMLRLTGAFATRPQPVSFDLLFENVAGQWRLFGISVQTPQAQAVPQAAKPTQTGSTR